MIRNEQFRGCVLLVIKQKWDIENPDLVVTNRARSGIRSFIAVRYTQACKALLQAAFSPTFFEAQTPMPQVLISLDTAFKEARVMGDMTAPPAAALMAVRDPRSVRPCP